MFMQVGKLSGPVFSSGSMIVSCLCLCDLVSSQVIFCSNNDPLFRDISVGNAGELWSSSKDITSSPAVPTPLSGDSSDSPLGALRNSADQSVIKTQYTQDPSQSFASAYDKVNEISSHAPQDVQASIDNIENSGSKSNILLKEKVQRTKSVI